MSLAKTTRCIWTVAAAVCTSDTIFRRDPLCHSDCSCLVDTLGFEQFSLYFLTKDFWMVVAEQALKWVEHRDALHAPYLGQFFHKSAESSGASVTDFLRPRKYRMLIMDHKTRGAVFCMVKSVAPTYQPGSRTHPLRINGSETLSLSVEQKFSCKPHFGVNFGACVSKWTHLALVR